MALWHGTASGKCLGISYLLIPYCFRVNFHTASRLIYLPLVLFLLCSRRHHCITALITCESLKFVKLPKTGSEVTYTPIMHILYGSVDFRIWIEGAKLFDRELAASLHLYKFRYELSAKSEKRSILEEAHGTS